MSKKPVQGTQKPPAHTVAHHAHHAKPSHAHKGHAGGGGAGPKGGSAKHHHVKHHHRKHKRRGLALDGVACCAAEALAMSLRLAGHPVTDADVLALAERTQGWDPDGGVSIEATLDAATRYGVAGERPIDARKARSPAGPPSGRLPGSLLEAIAPSVCDLSPIGELAPEFSLLDPLAPAIAQPFAVPPARRAAIGAAALPAAVVAEHSHGLILGVDLPGAHTVLATADGWWSWGECFQPETFPDAVIEEAWAVSWR